MSKINPGEGVRHKKIGEFSALREQAGLSIEDIAKITGNSTRTVYRWESGSVNPNKLVLRTLRDKVEEYRMNDYGKFTFIDLFAGIGGMRMGFESIGGKCLFTSEWDSHSVKTYLSNFPMTHQIEGDITKVNLDDIPGHDVLVAGFPCQPFSIAGVSKKNALGKPHGFRDKIQGTLFFRIAEILESHRPKAFLLENVKNLKSHDNGRTFGVICDTLDELGYTFDTRIIDAKSFVPQHRERIFIAGFRKDTGFNFAALKLSKPETGPKLKAILHPEDGSEKPTYPYTEGRMAKVNEKYTLSPKLWNYLQQYAAKHKARGNGFGFGLVTPEDTARTLSARYYKDGSEILIQQVNKRPRRLTPRECARLMGFDSGHREIKIPVSDTQAYRQFGNAVVVPVVEAIAGHMLPHILGEKSGVSNKQLRFEFNQEVVYKND
ncbi:MAG: DNA (cytosine-5-)-methyltransferase [Calditrichaeota bacterium]|nr:MAG: DNA (cytosine-5-)-methyltransferase [Calditrichota bacterium]